VRENSQSRKRICFLVQAASLRIMVLALIIGDFHIPHRVGDLHPKIKKLLQPGKIQHILCTGNLCSKETLEFLRGVCPSASDVHVAKGDFDEVTSFPETKVVTIGSYKFGLAHGHQVVPWGDTASLAILQVCDAVCFFGIDLSHLPQRQLDVDVLVTGHTHQVRNITCSGASRHQLTNLLLFRARCCLNLTASKFCCNSQIWLCKQSISHALPYCAPRIKHVLAAHFFSLSNPSKQ
jgi:putative phosphoesterase